MVLVVPSPKFQFHAVTLPVEASVNATFKDAVPVVGLALKLATGAGADTVMKLVLVTVFEPPGPVTVRLGE